MPVTRLHVHNGGDSKIPILQKLPVPEPPLVTDIAFRGGLATTE
jgi:hypothetical protein